MVVDIEKFITVAHRVVWCTLATVDRRNRPRSRVVHPIWESTDRGLVGWVTTRPTPLKLAHLAHTPYVSCSYWDAEHDIAVAECRAEWVDDLEVKEHAWDLFRAAPAPLGHDPYSIWPAGPADPDAAVLRLTPWRLRVALVRDAVPPPPQPATLP
jgi:uncharacterized pyridoxamine 5'-phosphate oxidase family protein